MRKTTILKLTIIIKEWIGNNVLKQPNGEFLVHPLDDVLIDDQKKMAAYFGLQWIQEKPSNCLIACSIWGGLDAAVISDLAPDEQTLGFVLEKFLEPLQPNGLCICKIKSSEVWSEEPKESILQWLKTFGIINVVCDEFGEFLLFRGRKRIISFERPLVLGVALSERKFSSVLNESFLKHAQEMNVKIIQPSENALIPDIVLLKSDKMEVPEVWKQVKVIVDMPEVVAVLGNRFETNSVAKKAISGLHIKLPKCSLTVDQDFPFPLVAKPNDSSIHDDLWFVARLTDINQLSKREFFYQEAIDHGQVLWKISVIGENVIMARRPSAIPSIEAPTRKLERSGHLHPRKKSLTGLHFPRNIPSPPISLVKALASALTRELKLHLYGFDLVVEKETGDIYLVDVNYFPSFVDVPGKDYVMFRMFKDLV